MTITVNIGNNFTNKIGIGLSAAKRSLGENV